ncbi:minor extracellular protease vpr domain protein [Brevibacillus laterosporus GI-9]|uniref:S8 family serine peptidase n=1 Tax=Brevibacillus laterosporus TaxID=1465 RepID=UPI0002404BC1|nr:S8 family serine peptidase [Brevibacillus laterosporus]CCF14532.1 minor extracellular protease vpr domain protein [Brevibacillus laterosporus GI-9]
MLRKPKKITSIALATSLLLGVIPYNVMAATPKEGLELDALLDVNELTKAKVTGETDEEVSTGPAYISPALDTKSSKMVTVIVQLKADPVVVTKGKSKSSEREARSLVSDDQDDFEGLIEDKGLDVDIEKKFEEVFNGMVVTLPANEIPKLAELPNVKAVYNNINYYSQPEVEVVSETAELPPGHYDANPLKAMKIPEMWKLGYTGKGLKVGVIDTGVDYLHPDLKDAYKGGYDSYDDDDDPYEQKPIPVEEDPEGKGYKGSHHGTHVAGTIVGRASNKTSDVHVRGIAYESDLYSYRVLGRHGGSSAQVIDGIERAVKDGMDVINLSLGSDLEKSPDSPDAIALNNAVLAGVIPVVANGNAANNNPNQYYYTAGSPAGAKLVISVGATTPPVELYTSRATTSFGKNYEFKVASYETGLNDFAKIVGTDALPLVFANLGMNSDFAKVDVKGKVVLVSRGGVAFVDKISSAKKAGAKAIIIYNGNDANGDGIADPDPVGRDDYFNSYLGDQMDAIPTFDMKGKEGRELVKLIQADPSKATITFSSEYPKTEEKGDLMADFSSRGPAMDDEYSIKPDVSAPGVSILSAKPTWKKDFPDANYDHAYQRLNGTSMATPHVAGLVLLLKQAHPDWTPFDVKAAMANTAVEIKDGNGVLYDVYSQGSGRVDGLAALKTPALLQTVEKTKILDKNMNEKYVTNYGTNVSFGLVSRDMKKPLVRTLQLKNTSDEEVEYEAEVIMHEKVTSVPGKPATTTNVDNLKVKLSEDDFTVKPGKSLQFNLQIEAKKKVKDGVYEGEVRLKSQDGHPDLHLPFVIHVGDEREENKFGFDSFKLSSTQVNPDSLTFSASADLQAKDINLIELQIWGLNDEKLGTMAVEKKTDKKGNLQLLKPGKLSFKNLTGEYVSTKTGKLTKPENGKYKVRIFGYQYDPENPVEKEEDIKIKYEAWSAISIQGPVDEEDREDIRELVNEAADDFSAKIVNVSELNKQVLKLPNETDEITYKVVESSNPDLIDNDGFLVKLPKKKQKKPVYLTVYVSSVKVPSIKKAVVVDVVLQPNKGKGKGKGRLPAPSEVEEQVEQQVEQQLKQQAEQTEQQVAEPTVQ